MSGGSGGSSSGGSGVSLTNKGDLLTFDTAETRLPVGSTNGQVLQVNSAVADGIEWANNIQSFVIACSDETTAFTTGTNKVQFRVPYAFTLTDVRCSVNTAPTGSTIVVDINESGSTILSTKLSIDISETTSTTASTPPVISDTALADDSIISIDIDQIGSTVAGTGLKVMLIGTRT